MEKRNLSKKIIKIILYILILTSICLPFAHPIEIEGHFIPYNYTVYGTYVEINEYTGGDYEISVPSYIWFRPVRKIASSAFEEVYYLSSVKIPDTVTSLGGSVFRFCVDLEQVQIGTGIKELRSNTFGICIQLQEVIVPANVEKITGSTFVTCESLKSVTFCNPAVEIDEDAFKNCNLDILTLKSTEGSTVEKYAAEHGINWEPVEELPVQKKQVNVIGILLALLCITGICLFCIYKMKHRGITAADLKKMLTPRSIFKSIINFVKRKRRKIVLIIVGIYIFILYIVPMGTPLEVKGILVPYDYTIHADCIEINRYKGNKNEVRIPSWLWFKPVKKITDNDSKCAFQDLDFITKIKVPNTVHYIEGRNFAGCDNLEEIKLSSNLTNIGGGTFSGCRKLKEIVIPYKVEEIGDNAFEECEMLESVTFQNPDTEFYVEAFLYDADKNGELECNPDMTIKAEKGSSGYKLAQMCGLKWEEYVYIPFTW